MRKGFLLFLLFFILVTADAWLFFCFYQQTGQEETDVLEAVWEDITYFPIPESAYDKERFSVSYADSWMDSRKFGGERTHEGCEIGRAHV